MTISGREMMLGFATFLIVLFGVTFTVGRNKWEDWQQITTTRDNQEEQILLSRNLIGQRETWEGRLEGAKRGLKIYPTGLNVIPQLLEALEAIAAQASLKVPNISPERENILGEISEVGIRCNWEGNLEACVRFLYALQADENSMYTIRTITITPTGKEGLLKGLLTVDCAYTRGTADTAIGPLKVEPLPAP